MDEPAKKKRNPPWTREELILALELYLRAGLLDDKSPEVQQLSEALKDLAFVQKEDPEVFRNPNGVAMKLANFAAFDPRYKGKGLTSGGRLDKEIFEEFFESPLLLSGAASALRGLWRPAADLDRVAEDVLNDEEYDARIESLEDHRVRIDRSIVLRRGEPGFRRTLIEAYEGRCALTGCNAVEALEAAHILGYRGNYSNKPKNGLLLRADIHTLFDLGLLAINSVDMSCVLAPELIRTDYEEYLGVQLRAPEEREFRPGRSHLDFHRAASRCG